ncbi:MAG TPA: hypothetical protein VGR53_04430 [Nitrososphaerales archaeon]|nr:hypothetical protein [Nitrososphaerales archaeon]
MNGIKLASVCFFALILAVSGIPKTTIAQQNPAISPVIAKAYAINMIGSYYALVASEQALWSNFSSIRHFFPLYHDLGDSFEVLVVNTTLFRFDQSNQTSYTNTVAFVFVPIPSPNPNVVVEGNLTLEDIVGLNFTSLVAHGNGAFDISWTVTPPLPSGEAFYDARINLQDTVRQAPLIWITNIDKDILNSTLVNSKRAAQDLYRYNGIEATPLPNVPDPVVAFLEAFWVYVIAGAVVLVTLVTGIHYWVKEGIWPFQKSGHPPKKRKNCK